MKQPSIDELLQRVDSKYTLVVAAAKRARTITEDNTGGSGNRLQKPVTQALYEIAEGKITYERTTEGIK
ncbi:MAG TPA: DNA-directed RNA polymerase subunit omega [Candidatus Deferrimicrobium sp.]|nr:DNA-directed RNA polymerase subunit omega [Candidatus Deferrimicrobium sp.]